LGNQAYAFAVLGRYEEVIDNCDNALQINPDYAGNYYKKAGIYAFQSNV
jgi:tetratricopeptide (TPR) repeat protein